jgi:hypothetical protein
MSVVQQSARNGFAPIRKPQCVDSRQHDIAHCRYGTTLSHNLAQVGRRSTYQAIPGTDIQNHRAPTALRRVQRLIGRASVSEADTPK